MATYTDNLNGTAGDLLSARSGWARTGSTDNCTLADTGTGFCPTQGTGGSGTWHSPTSQPTGNDQYAEAILGTFTSNSYTLGVRCDTSAAGGDGYLVRRDSATRTRLYKRISGAFTLLGTYNTALSTDYDSAKVRLEVSGTSLNVYLGATLVIGPITDSAISTGSVSTLSRAGTSTTTTPNFDEWGSGDLGATSLTATASGSIAFTGSATATVALAASSSGSIAFTGSATATVAVKATASGSIDFTGTGTATVASAGGASASGSIAFTGSATATVRIAAVGSGSIAFTGSAAATVRITASASGSITFTGSGVFGETVVAVPARQAQKTIPETYNRQDWPRLVKQVVEGIGKRTAALESATTYTGLGDYADDTASAAGGVAVGSLYRTGSVIKVRLV